MLYVCMFKEKERITLNWFVCDGILRKWYDMIILFNCSQCLRWYERDWFSCYEILRELSSISDVNTYKFACFFQDFISIYYSLLFDRYKGKNMANTMFSKLRSFALCIGISISGDFDKSVLYFTEADQKWKHGYEAWRSEPVIYELK